MHTPRARIAALIGIACLILLALINGESAGRLANSPHPIQFALFYAGLALIVWGFLGGRAGLTGYTAVGLPWIRPEIVVLTAVLILALVLRLWALETAV